MPTVRMIVLSLCLTLAACATGYAPLKVESTDLRREIQPYQTGQTYRAERGDIVFEKGLELATETRTVMFRSLKDVETVFPWNQSALPLLGRDRQYRATDYNPANDAYAVFIGQTCIAPDACPALYALVDGEGRLLSKKVCDHNGAYLFPDFFVREQVGDTLFEKQITVVREVQPGSRLTRVLLNRATPYVVSFQYQVFRDNLAAPKWERKLQFSLGQNNIVGYEDFTLKVLSSDANVLTYQILRP